MKDGMKRKTTKELQAKHRIWKKKLREKGYQKKKKEQFRFNIQTILDSIKKQNK